MQLILGHNQFIGISHLSQDRGREREKRFSNVQNIHAVAETASALGYRNMIVETHPRMLEFLEYYEENQTFTMNFYLQVPYVQGYVQKMNQNGMRGLISEVIGRTGLVGAGSIALTSAFNLIKRDYVSVALSNLKLEIAPFAKFDIKAVILHNVLTDLLMALEVRDVFSEYVEFVSSKLKLQPGLGTLNFKLTTDNLKTWGIRPAFVMTPVNVKGFDMNPSKVTVDAAIRDYDGNVVAMNVLGGGAYTLADSAAYVNSFDNVTHCVVGASTREHLQELKDVFAPST